MIPRAKRTPQWPARDELAGLRASFNTDDDVTETNRVTNPVAKRKIMSWPL